ncbi:SET and MYND domain-containing protein 4-like [Ptychodera flava]|uniref:SET and MYND domain-containing protein 4-like n=1 Tax=Ptychodera flava TaxID=63121 RepID=UPI00396A0EF4
MADLSSGRHVEVWYNIVKRLWTDARKNNSPDSFQRRQSNREWLAQCQAFLKTRGHDEVLAMIKKCQSDKMSEKDDRKSADFRITGNKHFQKKRFREALKNYNQSILYAKPRSKVNGEEAEDCQLSLAYANRSAVLFHLQHYEQCMADIQRALKHGYPENLRYKLYKRKGQCHYHRGDLQSAKQAFHRAVELCRASNVEETKKDAALTELEKLLAMNAVPSQVPANHRTGSVQNEAVSQNYVESTNIANASESVALKFHKDCGRYLTADRDIKAGDVLIEENAYAVILLPTHYNSHCYHCIQEISVAPIPCPQCSCVRYCSEACQEQSWQLYHSVECPLWQILEQLGTFGHLSLRILQTAGWPNICKYSLMAEKGHNSEVPDTKAEYLADYCSIYNLMPHSDNHPAEYNFYCAITSVILSKLVTKPLQQSACIPPGGATSRAEGATIDGLCQAVEKVAVTQGCSHTSNSNAVDFKSVESRTLTDGTSEDAETVDLNLNSPLTNAELQVATLLLRHMQQLRCNVHAITAVEAEGDRAAVLGDGASMVETVKQVRIASAVFPTASLLNHSCDPNVIVSYHGNQLTVRATRTIPCGHEILHCYGPHVNHMTKEKRQAALQEQYYFSCRCEACEKEVKADLKEAFRCDQCSHAVVAKSDSVWGKCVNKECQAEKNLQDSYKVAALSRDLLSRAIESLESSEFQESLSTLQRCYKLQQSVLYKHNIDLSNTEDCLARCFVTLGDSETACRYLKRSIATVAFIYGNNSIELAHELQKLAQIMFNSRQTATLEIVNRALDIFKIHCSFNHPNVKELSEMKSLLDGL